ncbi:EF-hand domain-containing protein 1 [Thoreauomyces humboldtii]|nr:EF-hand domain-containing protein 1 [Thoreauomyces humboldtii]
MHELRSPTQVSHIPFLPGNTVRDVTKNDFRVRHTLDYKNGYALRHVDLPPDLKSPEYLLRLPTGVGADPWITYGDRPPQASDHTGRTPFVPAHVLFDKVVCIRRAIGGKEAVLRDVGRAASDMHHSSFCQKVLRFDAYFKQTVHESVEKYHLRRVRILYYVEDDSIAVVEPPVENSGIPQGVLIKRQRLPKNSTEFFTARDFNLGQNVTFYGKTFRVVDCDVFTRKYMNETEHITLNNPERMPEDPHEQHRLRPTRAYVAGPKPPDKLKRFLENDRKVLRFFCVWDDRLSMFGELREFVLHYYLVDDSVEVREVQKPNNGRDPFPILLRRQQLPKAFHELTDVNDASKYTWKDFKVGGIINILGRPFLIRDCDDSTRAFYSAHLGDDMQALPVAPPSATGRQQGATDETPPYNGFGSVEDSLGSVKYLVLKPPKKDFIKMLENEHKVLRFVAKLTSKHKEDSERRFVISYRLSDDMMTIYEPPQRNAGILGGKFMERTRVLLPGSALTDPQGPSYYTARDLHVGNTVTVFAHHFVLLDADEYVFNYMESDPNQFPQSDAQRCVEKARSVVGGRGGEEGKRLLKEVLDAASGDETGRCDRLKLLEAGKRVWGDALTNHEVITLARQFEDTQRKVNYDALLQAL